MTLHERPALLNGPAIRPEGPPTWPFADSAVATSVQRAIENGVWGRYQGEWTDEFIAKLSAAHRDRDVWLCSSGTMAVELGLRGLGVQPGDEVILAAYDFKANFVNVTMLGAIPVLVDVHPETWQMDVTPLEQARSDRTRALIASHLHGGQVDMLRLMEWARKYRIGVVEDACQNPGSLVQKKPAGTWGDVGVLSFGGSKLVCAGRGGAVVTSDKLVLERIKRFVLRGNDVGPLSELQAAALLPQWDRLKEQHVQRFENVKRLQAGLEELWPGGSNAGLRPLCVPETVDESAYYKVGFQYFADRFQGLSRDAFCCALRAEGIAMDPGFRGLHKIHASRRFRAVGELSQATAADEGMTVLHHPVLLMDEPHVLQIVRAIGKIQRWAGELAAMNIPRRTGPWDE